MQRCAGSATARWAVGVQRHRPALPGSALLAGAQIDHAGSRARVDPTWIDGVLLDLLCPRCRQAGEEMDPTGCLVVGHPLVAVLKQPLRRAFGTCRTF